MDKTIDKRMEKKMVSVLIKSIRGLLPRQLVHQSISSGSRFICIAWIVKWKIQIKMKCKKKNGMWLCGVVSGDYSSKIMAEATARAAELFLCVDSCVQRWPGLFLVHRNVSVLGAFHQHHHNNADVSSISFLFLRGSVSDHHCQLEQLLLPWTSA